ncbi:MAG: response regulator transcription factor [Synechococcaceae cyanobacterium]|nr:response regulator transcription factor [Synechococcaceae cyanobacterium]
MQPSLLVVEDDETIRETIREALALEGFSVTACGNGREALETLQAGAAGNAFSLVVLDLMLPGLGGLDLCRQLRRQGNQTPILVVSARDSETDRVLGLEVGADDYLVKPFGMRELVARCRALLRRSRPAPGSEAEAEPEIPAVLRHANLCLYTQECRVTRDGLDVNLSPKEYRLLELFMQHPRRVWSRDKLIEQVWGVDYFGDSKTVDVHIRWLREKLEANPSAPEHLLTVRGFGYRFG